MIDLLVIGGTVLAALLTLVLLLSVLYILATPDPAKSEPSPNQPCFEAGLGDSCP